MESRSESGCLTNDVMGSRRHSEAGEEGRVSVELGRWHFGGRFTLRRSKRSGALRASLYLILLAALALCGSDILWATMGPLKTVPTTRGRQLYDRRELALGGGGNRGDGVPLYYTVDRMSVEHYMIPGVILPAQLRGVKSSAGGGASVVLHLFVKCILHPPGANVLCNGFGFAESTGNVSTVHHHLVQPPEVDLWAPKIEVRSGLKFGQGQIASYSMNVSMARDAERLRPFHFRGVLPVALRDEVPEIRVDDWPRSQPFRNLDSLENVETPIAHQDKTFFLMSAFYYKPPAGSYAFAAQLLVHHVRHHLAMGFAGDIMYVQRHYPEKLLENGELLEFVRKGQLQLVVWDAFPRYHDPLVPHIDQHLQYHHGLLENWGRGVRILLGDVDEFLVTDKPSSITKVLSSLGWPDQARVMRYDVMCSGKVCQGDGDNEWPLWWSPDEQPLRHYTLIDRQGDSSRDPKVIVSPEMVQHHFVHYASVLPEGSDILVPPERAYIVHTRSLYWKRTNKTDFHRDTSWHWLYRNERKAKRPTGGQLRLAG